MTRGTRLPGILHCELPVTTGNDSVWESRDLLGHLSANSQHKLILNLVNSNILRSHQSSIDLLVKQRKVGDALF